MANLYETMYILRPDLNEEAVDQAIEKYQTLLREGGAQVLETQHRGKRRLAYEINKNAEGIYAVIDLQAEPAVVAELDRQLNLNEAVVRTKVLRPDLR